MYNSKDLIRNIKQIVMKAEPNAKVILFGSKVRGDSNESSDWDVLVLLDKNKIEYVDFENITYPLYELGWNVGELISTKLYTNDEWEKRSITPFYKSIQQEGLVL